MMADDALVDHILRYGGKCRDCADNAGVCEGSGLPCVVDEARKAIRHVLKAREHYYSFTRPSPSTVERCARAIESGTGDPDKFHGTVSPTALRDAAVVLEASGQLREIDPDVKRRLESVATTLETCGKHGIPIDFAQLAHDIRAALSRPLEP